MADVPEIPILLLGEAGVGKSTFLSRLTLGHTAKSGQSLPTLRDLDQPFPFDIKLYNRQYRFEFNDTASPSNYTLLRPSVLVLCYSIADPASLAALTTKWKLIVETHFSYNADIPIIVLGLKRDARTKEDYNGRVRTAAAAPEDGSDGAVLHGRTIIYPQEALRIAQEMRCDKYCECSALTGELCREVFEDIARTAAMTTTTKGGQTEGTSCTIQ